MTGQVVEVHTSDRGQFKRCRQLWDFTSNLRMNLEPIPNGPNALWFGTGMHLAVATYYTPLQPKRSIEMAHVAWEWYCATAEFKVDLDTWELGHGMIQHYGKWAPRNDKFRVVHVEQSQEAPIYTLNRDYGGYPKGTQVVYSYRLDGLLQDQHDRYFIHELKTAASFDNTYDYLLNDDQVGSYIEREQERLKVKIAGVVYTVMRKKSPVPLKRLVSGDFSVDQRQDTTYELAYAELNFAYNGNIPPKYNAYLDYLAGKPENFVHREVVMRNPGEIKMVGVQMRMEIADMLGSPRIYRTANKMNCDKCAFFIPCVAKWEGRDIRPLLAVGYRQREGYSASMRPRVA